VKVKPEELEDAVLEVVLEDPDKSSESSSDPVNGTLV